MVFSSRCPRWSKCDSYPGLSASKILSPVSIARCWVRSPVIPCPWQKLDDPSLEHRRNSCLDREVASSCLKASLALLMGIIKCWPSDSIPNLLVTSFTKTYSFQLPKQQPCPPWGHREWGRAGLTLGHGWLHLLFPSLRFPFLEFMIHDYFIWIS